MTNRIPRVSTGLERPNRFDCKYISALPGPRKRERYLRDWSDRLDAAMRVRPADQRALADATAGFSFAYLKERFRSSICGCSRSR